jgi:hypothetical protein
MPQPNPDPGHDRPFPWEQDEDDLERPGVTIRPLGHAELAALVDQLHGDGHQPDAPAGPAWRWPQDAGASRWGGGAPQSGRQFGWPGGSAQATYRRRRNRELARRLPGLLVRLAGTGTAGLLAGLLVGRLAAALAIAVTGWLLRPRLSSDTLAWRRGAAGERATARRLRRLRRRGWALLHDVAVPGSSANLDHLLIGPGGVVLVDSKHYRGRIHVSGDGLLWVGRHPLGDTIQTVLWEARCATRALGVGVPGIGVRAVVCVHRGQVPYGRLEGPVPILTPAALLGWLRGLPPALAPWQVQQLTRQALTVLRPAIR